MTREETLLKESVKLAKNGKRPRLTTPIDLPPGVHMDRAGKFVLPRTDAERADLLFACEQLRYGLQHRVDRLKELEAMLDTYFINNLPKSKASGIAGKVARVQIKDKAVPQVADWSKFYAYVAKHGAWELLQRRLGETAAKERLDAGEGAAAGLTIFHAKKVSVTKI